MASAAGLLDAPMRLPLSKLWVFLVGALALASVTVVAGLRHAEPSRCDPGWIKLGPRCCAPGQTLDANNHCAGKPTQCPRGFRLGRGAYLGCVRAASRVRVDGMLLKLGPNDWQSEQVPRIEKQVGTLWVDETEVSNEQWSVCAETNACPIKPLSEPGQPVANLTVEDAQRFCAANGGRLPTLEERIALSAGGDSRRYPWGQTGLVCRRAVFGVKHGPCAEGGTQPDVTGGHAAGRSSDGLFDLSGNVAELAIDAQQRAWACGGSFRSTTALELKSWACALFLGATDDVGFRCVYDPKAEPAR